MREGLVQAEVGSCLSLGGDLLFEDVLFVSKDHNRSTLLIPCTAAPELLFGNIWQSQSRLKCQVSDVPPPWVSTSYILLLSHLVLLGVY